MYMKDRWLRDKMLAAGISYRQLADALGLYEGTVSRFVGGYSNLSYTHIGDVCVNVGVDPAELEQHIEMTEKESKQYGRDDIPVCAFFERRPNAWRALEREQQAENKRQKSMGTLERRVAYCKRNGISYGELQRRMYFDKVLWGYFYG